MTVKIVTIVVVSVVVSTLLNFNANVVTIDKQNVLIKNLGVNIITIIGVALRQINS